MRAALLLALGLAAFASGPPLQAVARQDEDSVDLALVAVGRPDGDLLLRSVVEPRPEGLPAGVRLEHVVYASDGLAVDGYLAWPEGVDPAAPLPALVYNRGGNRDFGVWTDERAAARLGSLAARGYVVVASQYRGNGPGLARYPAASACPDCGSAVGGVGREEFGGADVDDVLALLPLLDALPEADGARIGMYGWSRGGLMTWIAMARTDRLRAVVVGSGVADSGATLDERSEMEHVYADLVPGWSDPEARAAALLARSPLRWVERLHPETPALVLVGSADWRVSPLQGLDMARALVVARRPVRLALFEGGDHGLSEWRAEVDAQAGAFLDRYVRDGEPWPSLEPHGR